MEDASPQRTCGSPGKSPSGPTRTVADGENVRTRRMTSPQSWLISSISPSRSSEHSSTPTGSAFGSGRVRIPASATAAVWIERGREEVEGPRDVPLTREVRTLVRVGAMAFFVRRAGRARSATSLRDVFDVELFGIVRTSVFGAASLLWFVSLSASETDLQRLHGVDACPSPRPTPDAPGVRFLGLLRHIDEDEPGWVPEPEVGLMTLCNSSGCGGIGCYGPGEPVDRVVVDCAHCALRTTTGTGLVSAGKPGELTIGGDRIVLGSLDRSLIDEVMKRNINGLRYCYQLELVQNHALAGKIVIRFTIDENGAVSSALTKSTTLGNPAVEGCVEKQLTRMQFPPPTNGGVVIVVYPLVFSPG